jgi:hypothetical protein
MNSDVKQLSKKRLQGKFDVRNFLQLTSLSQANSHVTDVLGAKDCSARRAAMTSVPIPEHMLPTVRTRRFITPSDFLMTLADVVFFTFVSFGAIAKLDTPGLFTATR